MQLLTTRPPIEQQEGFTGINFVYNDTDGKLPPPLVQS